LNALQSLSTIDSMLLHRTFTNVLHKNNIIVILHVCAYSYWWGKNGTCTVTGRNETLNVQLQYAPHTHSHTHTTTTIPDHTNRTEL